MTDKTLKTALDDFENVIGNMMAEYDLLRTEVERLRANSSGVYRQCSDAADEIERLRAENEALKSDAERLDWLELHEASLVTHREEIDGGEFGIWWTVAAKIKRIRADSLSGHPLGSVRAAIDKARAQP